MLDGFVVPHAHFRVFHGNAAAESTGRASTDQLALLFRPRGAEGVPTDLHVREFAQLEAQVKALQQQLPAGAASHPTSRLVGVAQAGALAECFSFYARLFTPEAFTWPDFLSIVVAKLTEHFVASDTDLVRRAILDVFRGARAHLARVTDASKIAALVRGLLRQDGDALSTVWALQIVEAMPSLAVDDNSIRGSVLHSLETDNATEKRVAVAAARVILPLSAAFRQAVFSVIASSKSPALVELMAFAFDERDQHTAEEAWNFCASSFHDQVRDEDALQCLRAAGSIVVKSPETMVARHLQLIRYVVTRDPRPLLVSNVWSTCPELVQHLMEKDMQAQFFEITSLQLQPGAAHDTTASTIRILNCFSASQGQVPIEIVERAHNSASASSQHVRLFIELLSRCAHRELTDAGDRHPGDRGLIHLNKLIQYLSPHQFRRGVGAWFAASAALKDLTSRFPQRLGNFAGECYTHLLGVAQHKNLGRYEAALWVSLSHVAAHCPYLIISNSELLTSNTTLSFDAKTKQAIAVCLVIASSLSRGGRQDEWIKHCLRLTCDSDNDRYTVARVAMCHGASQFATSLLKPISDSIDSEFYGSWLRALIAISDASTHVEVDQTVSVDALRRLEEGKALLQAEVSAQAGFEFQVAFVGARVRWMELMLQAQQYAGEIAHTGRSGGVREHRLSEALRECAAEFMAIRSKMLCATGSDRDVLIYHARLCSLIADAVVHFLIPAQSKSQVQVRDSSAMRSNKNLDSCFEFLSSLETDVKAKAHLLSSLDATRKPLVGSTVFVQLLRVICTLPLLLPRQFFRSQSRPSDGLRCNMQFLTQAEATSVPSKPRTRSQLGVAVGTEFNSSLQGAVAFPQGSSILPSISAFRVGISLTVDKADGSSPDGMPKQVSEVTIPFSAPNLSFSSESEITVFPIDMPVVVPSDLLTTKGTYTIQATAWIVDSNGESWALALTGGRRGIIVY